MRRCISIDEILEATGYFNKAPGQTIDPYRRQKELGWLQATSTLAHALPQGLPAIKDRLWKLIHMSLWGNQADLSIWPVQGERGGNSKGEGGESHLLVDNSEIALKQIEGINGGYVDFIVDNIGTELSFDLLLVDAMLGQNPAINIRLHVKPYPCFVSDTIASDITEAISRLQNNTPVWECSVAQRLEQALRTGQLLVVTHFYWASPFPAWDMPKDLRAILGESNLIISKGDVNYRRWLGDARWSSDAPLATIINPATSLLLLRVLKSDVIAGLKFRQEKDMFIRDPNWQFNGQWGVIQLVEPQKRE